MRQEQGCMQRRGPGQSNREDGERRYRRGDETGNERRQERGDAAMRYAENWARAGRWRGSGAQGGEAPPMPPHLPQRARSGPASHPLARPGPHRPAEAILLRPPQVPAQRPKMEPDLPGPQTQPAAVRPTRGACVGRSRGLTRGEGGERRWRGRWPRLPGPAPALHLLRQRPAPPPPRPQVHSS